MNTWQRMGIVVGVVAATVLLADGAFAAGNGKGAPRRAGSANGTVARTATATRTQLRQQLRDGSCLTGTTAPAAAGTATGTGDRLRLRDGSCLTTK